MSSVRLSLKRPSHIILIHAFFCLLPELIQTNSTSSSWHKSTCQNTWSVKKVMRLIQYNSVFIFKLQIEFVPFKIVPLGGYTSLETFPLFIAELEVANRNRF